MRIAAIVSRTLARPSRRRDSNRPMAVSNCALFMAVSSTGTGISPSASYIFLTKLLKLGKPAGKEMPAPALSGNLQEMKGEYTIQVSAWRDKEIAQEIVRRLEEAGYPAFAEDRAYKDGTWYTVRVGRYASRKDAEMAVQSFAEELRSSYWIDKAKAK